MRKPIDKINLSVKNGKGRVVTNGSTANILIDLNKVEKTSGTGTSTVSFAEVTVTLTHAAEDTYTVQVIDDSGTKSGVNITINRALGYEAFGSDATDIRYFAPWYGVGAIVPIAQHYDSGASAQKWFINLALIFVGKPADRSLEVEEVTTTNESEYRTMAVYK